MSVKPGDMKFYGSANMSTVDGTTQGGAVTVSTKLDFTDLASTQVLNYVSSSTSDTGVTITATGRDSTGVIQTETKTLTGQTPVAGSQSFQRILAGSVGGTAAVGDVAMISSTAVVSAHTCQAGSANATGTTPTLIKLQAGDGAARVLGEIIRTTGGAGPNQLREIIGLPATWGTDIVAVNRDWATVPDATTTYNIHDGILFDLAPSQVTKAQRPFYNAAADVPGGAIRSYFEKDFAVNTNTTTALTSAAILKQADISGGTLGFALCSSLNDIATTANRQTCPTSGLVSIANTTLAAAITSTAQTSISVTADTGFPASIVGPGYVIQIDSEVMLVTAGAGTTTWTVQRGFGGSTAATHASAAAVNQYFNTGAAPASTSVASPGNLPPGATPNTAGAQGVWWMLLLAAGQAPQNTGFTERASGQTT